MNFQKAHKLIMSGCVNLKRKDIKFCENMSLILKKDKKDGKEEGKQSFNMDKAV